MSDDLTVEIDSGVAILTLNRPEQLNAYTAEMGALLSRAYRECDEDDDVRAIVVTGAGRAFCAGADFSCGASLFDAPAADGTFSASPITPAAFELRKPVIAAVNGHPSESASRSRYRRTSGSWPRTPNTVWCRYGGA